MSPTWVAVSWLMISDIIGTSVLTFAGVAYELGWVLPAICILAFFPVSLFVSVLMCRTRELLLSTAHLQGRDVPCVATMGAVASAALKKSWAGPLVHLTVYGYILLGQGSYLLILGTSWQQAVYIDPDSSSEFHNKAVCLPVAVVYGCLFLLIPVCSVRRLGESIWICRVNTFIIVLVLAISLTDLGVSGSRAETKAYAFAPELSLPQAVGATTNIVYAFASEWMYFEVMETMEKPADFPWAFALAGSLTVTSYLAVLLLGYGFGAGRKRLLDSLSLGLSLRVAASLLFLHVIVLYLLTNIVLARYFHSKSGRTAVEARTCWSYLQYGGISVAMLLFSYIFANVLPFFNQMSGLIGGVFAGPVNFVLPILSTCWPWDASFSAWQVMVAPLNWWRAT